MPSSSTGRPSTKGLCAPCMAGRSSPAGAMSCWSAVPERQDACRHSHHRHVVRAGANRLGKVSGVGAGGALAAQLAHTLRSPLRRPTVGQDLERLRLLRDKVTSPGPASRNAADRRDRLRAATDGRGDPIRNVVEKSCGVSGQGNDADRAGTLSDRLRALTAKISQPSEPLNFTRSNDVIRTAEEHNRNRERDRSRYGPS